MRSNDSFQVVQVRVRLDIHLAVGIDGTVKDDFPLVIFLSIGRNGSSEQPPMCIYVNIYIYG